MPVLNSSELDSFQESQSLPESQDSLQSPTEEPQTPFIASPVSVNSLQVTLTDKDTPLVLLAGPPASGKTMTLIRLARYLAQKGYQLVPDRKLRPASDKDYEQLCDNFPKMIHDPEAAQATNLISFLLVKVIKNGRTLCQILEAPGEHYFNPQQPHSPFPTYLNQIFNDRMRKIWTILLEPDWKGQQERDAYVERIRTFKEKMTKRDKVIFLCNKIDKTAFVLGRGQINDSSARKDIQDSYPGIFEIFRNKSPLAFFGSSYLCDFLPFHTGTYTENELNGKSFFQPGPDEFPARLWNQLEKYIRG